MTAADRVFTRGRSLSYPGGIDPPGIGRRHSSPPPQRGRVAKLSQPESSAQEAEYTTYAPQGEKCRVCTKPFTSLERVRRAARTQSPAGVPSRRPYAHIVCPDDGVVE